MHMKIAIEHSTAWHAAENAGISTQLLRMTPRDSARQHVLSWDLSLPCAASCGTDPFGNVQHVLTVDAAGHDISLTARGVVEIRTQADEDDDGLNPLLFLRTTALTQSDDALLDFADNFRIANPSRDVLRALMIAVGGEVALTVPAVFSGGHAAAAFAGKQGSCHDQTHVFLACARQIGVPARYVSGYVHGGDRIASHAWAEVFVHGRWHTFDVAHRLDRPTTHLKLAIGMDYLDACPVRGVRFAGTQ
jgi:transglutaminase-like putative cysteine protease